MTPLAARKELLISPPPEYRQYLTQIMAHVQEGLDVECFICPPCFSPEIKIRPPDSKSALTAAALWKRQRETTPPQNMSVCGVWKKWRWYLEGEPATDSRQQGDTGFSRVGTTVYMVIMGRVFFGQVTLSHLSLDSKTLYNPVNLQQFIT